MDGKSLAWSIGCYCVFWAIVIGAVGIAIGITIGHYAK